VEDPLQCTQFRLQPAVSSHAISLGAFVMAITNLWFNKWQSNIKESYKLTIIMK
jgi:hypothetical protein